MALVEKHIHQRFASLEDDTVPPPPVFVESATASDAEPAVLQAPFAKVNTVAEGSPADVAGMKPGDEIRSFGYVDSTNHDDLKRVAEVVQGNEGVSLLSLTHFLSFISLLSLSPLSLFQSSLATTSYLNTGLMHVDGKRRMYLSGYRGQQPPGLSEKSSV